MAQHTYRILLTQEPEGGYTMNVPALPGDHLRENIDHAMSMAQEAIELYEETLKTSH